MRKLEWLLAPGKRSRKFRDRRGYVLFIDARKLGRLVDRREPGYGG